MTTLTGVTLFPAMDKLSSATGTRIYAWALMTNHAHILLRSGAGGLPGFIRRLLSGYAISYSFRHSRHGHPFQNRYKSIVCEADAYLKELIRYIHLNPFRAGLVKGYAGTGSISMVLTCRHYGQNQERQAGAGLRFEMVWKKKREKQSEPTAGMQNCGQAVAVRKCQKSGSSWRWIWCENSAYRWLK